MMNHAQPAYWMHSAFPVEREQAVSRTFEKLTEQPRLYDRTAKLKTKKEACYREWAPVRGDKRSRE
jgi:hypothetical protein